MSTIAVDRALAAASKVAERFGIGTAAGRIDVCRRAMARQLLEVAVWGRFKAGKSSLLNALAGKSVLPTGVVPVTAVLTSLRHGPRESARVRLLNGREEAIPLERIGDFVTEERNPHNAKGAAEISIELPSLAAFSGLEFLDTPGTGSAHAHNTRVSAERLPYAEASLVAVSSDQPMSDDDVRLVGDLLRVSPRVAVLVTKADRLSERELAEVLGYARNVLNADQAADVPLFPVSSLDSPRAAEWRARFLNEWLEPMRRDQAGVREKVIERKVSLAVEECASFLHLALAAASQADAERAALKATEPAERAALDRATRAIRDVVSRSSSQARPRIEKCLLAGLGEVAESMISEFDARWPGWGGGFAAIVDEFKKWLAEALRVRIDAVSVDAGRSMEELARDLSADLQALCGEYRERLSARLASKLGVGLSAQPFEVEVQVSQPDLSVGRPFETPWTLFSWAIPTRLVKPILHWHFRRRIAEETEKNIRRMVSVWSDGLRDAFSAAGRREEACLRTQLETALTAMGSAPASAQAIRAALEELTKLAPGS